MTIKKIIKDFNDQLKNKEIKSAEHMAKTLSVIAVKAETIGDNESQELTELCDRLRLFFKMLPNVTSEEILTMSSDFAKLIHFSEKKEYSFLFNDEDGHDPDEDEMPE